MTTTQAHFEPVTNSTLPFWSKSRLICEIVAVALSFAVFGLFVGGGLGWMMFGWFLLGAVADWFVSGIQPGTRRRRVGIALVGVWFFWFILTMWLGATGRVSPGGEPVAAPGRGGFVV